MTATQNMYKDLNLNEGASLSEIKAAYRLMAKTYHPDSAAAKESASAAKFQKAYDAYKGLLRGALNGESPADKKESASELQPGFTPYAFAAKSTEGLDVIYDLAFERPEAFKEIKISLPVTRREACPRCLGRGITLVRKGAGFVYKPAVCDRCEGRGCCESEAKIELTLSPEMLKFGKVRVRNLGGYIPKDGLRGDLVLNFEFKAGLPRKS